MGSGDLLYALAYELFPICRSLTGQGVRETLRLLSRDLPGIEIHEVDSGTQCFDWKIPDEWNINDAYIITPDGEKIADFKRSNLHVVGYSIPVDQAISLEVLDSHLHSLPELPDAIPYVTSYYSRRWGFCISHAQRTRLKAGNYYVKIDSQLAPGHLTYGELIIPGATEDEIFLSTYICHPSMANNEVSGPVVAHGLAQWLLSLPFRKFTYRFIFIPETIGSIMYLSRNLAHLKAKVRAGFNISCVGDERCCSYLPSRAGNTLADRVAKHVLKHLFGEYKTYSFLDRGSDERQYCSPGVDLPLCCISRSKYGEYPEYHTSLDNMDFITPAGLAGSLECLKKCLVCLEGNEILQATKLCEPHLGPRGLYPTLSERNNLQQDLADTMNVLAYSDGGLDLLDIADILGRPQWELLATVQKLKEHALLRSVGSGGARYE